MNRPEYLGTNLTDTTTEIVDQRRAYSYDPIGNRQGAYAGSSLTPNPAYTANDLNQYTAATNSLGVGPHEAFLDTVVTAETA